MTASAVNCDRCLDYELIEIPGQKLKVPCPECGPEIVVCPCHGQRVMTRGGVVVGKCWECSNEAARAMQWLREHPLRRAA